MECFSAGTLCGRFAHRGVAVAALRRWEELWQRASVENTEIGGKRCARARNAARAIPRIVCATFGRWRCDWLLALCFERVVQRRQIFCKQLIELFCDVTKLAPKRVDVREVIAAGLCVGTENGAVKLVSVFPQTFFAGDRAAFSGSHDFLAHPVNFSVKVRDLFAKRIALRHRGATLSQCLA